MFIDLKKNQKMSSSTTTSTRKELLFSGGAGALTYEMGYAQALLEIVGKPKLQEYIIGGVSSGAECDGFQNTSL